MNDTTEGGELTRAQLEGRLLYSLIVAGKSARFANEKVANLMRGKPRDVLPFAWLAELDARGELEAELRRARVGRYRTFVPACRWLVSHPLDLRTVTPQELEQCPGIGQKTARFFVVWTRPHERYAVLDVHVLRWLRKLGHEAPKQTPHGRTYLELEALFLQLADKAGLTPRQLDFEIWRSASTAANEAPQ